MKVAFNIREELADMVDASLDRLQREMKDGSPLTLRPERYHAEGSEGPGFQAVARALSGGAGYVALSKVGADSPNPWNPDDVSRAIHVFDDRGIIRYTNAAFDDIFGYPRGTLLRKHLAILNFYSIEENARLMAGIVVKAHVSGGWNGWLRYRRRDGSPFTLATRIRPHEVSGRRCWMAVQAVTATSTGREFAAAAGESSRKEQAAMGPTPADEASAW